MVEPTACAVHGALGRRRRRAATPSSCSAPARSACSPSPPCAACTPAGTIVAAAKHPDQRELARELGADRRGRARRAAPGRAPHHRLAGPGDGDIDRLTGGADVVVDCVGQRASLAPQALAVVGPGGRVALVGMPGHVQRRPHRRCGTARSQLAGAYAYGTEHAGRHGDRGAAPSTWPSSWSRRPTSAGSCRATYPLARYRRRHRPRRRRRPPRRGEDRLRPPRREGDGTRVMPRPGFVLDVDRSTPPIAVLARRGLPAREAARRAAAGSSTRPSRSSRSTTSTAPSATRCSTRGRQRPAARRCCARA